MEERERERETRERETRANRLVIKWAFIFNMITCLLIYPL